jgi:hypothetical protein
MTDAPEAPVEGAESDAPKTTGRPRPAETQERDAKVLAFLEAARDEAGAYVGKTRDEIAAAVELGGNLVYLSLYRLNRDGKIARGQTGGAHHWSIKTDAPTEVPVA